MSGLHSSVKISDSVIWFKHLDVPAFVQRLERLKPDDSILLEADGVPGRWQRMQTGSDNRLVLGIKPVGEMKDTWQTWFARRKGERIEVREIAVVDEYLAASSALFVEWASASDEEAFRDL